MKIRMQRLLAAAAIFAGGAHAAAADEIADFYRGRTLTIVVGTQAASGFDIYARALGRHIGRHIPGNPSVVVQNMPGASGINAANWLTNIASKDGGVIGTFPHNVTTEPLYGNKAAKFGADDIVWIGNVEEGNALCGIATDAGAATVEELRQKEVVWGATGATGTLGSTARALNNLLGTKLKIVYGYKGSAAVKHAIQSGEVKGICGMPYSTYKSFWSDMLESGRFKLFIQLAGRPIPGLKDVSQLTDHLKSDEQREIAKLVFATYTIGRGFAAPKGVPLVRIAALRAAFNATMKDERFLADAKKAKMDVSPMTGEEVESIVRDLYRTSPKLVSKAYAATATK